VRHRVKESSKALVSRTLHDLEVQGEVAVAVAVAMARVVSMNSSIWSNGLDLIGVGLVIVGREEFPGLFAAEHDSPQTVSRTYRNKMSGCAVSGALLLSIVGGRGEWGRLLTVESFQLAIFSAPNSHRWRWADILAPRQRYLCVPMVCAALSEPAPLVPEVIIEARLDE
jgi:hypothetical protein